MTATTKTEKDILIKITTDLDVAYNPGNIAKELNLSRVGTFKALKELEKKGLVKGRKLGKANFYSVDLNDGYTRKNIEILLMEKARQHEMWVDEFEELAKYVDIMILFGSIIRNESKANDIDVLLVFKKENNDKINSIIKEKNKILTKRIHPIKQTKSDLVKNIKKKDKVILSAIKTGIVLYGFEKILEVLKGVTSKE
ncbi:MAG: nucleotidyltransferase domain-containing protein [Nanoarchaeota archaeon]|nr:nucleotidyltransferase domain-containing protein [Nanoarchaeota archaeon]